MQLLVELIESFGHRHQVDFVEFFIFVLAFVAVARLLVFGDQLGPHDFFLLFGKSLAAEKLFLLFGNLLKWVSHFLSLRVQRNQYRFVVQCQVLKIVIGPEFETRLFSRTKNSKHHCERRQT